ncbi:MAG: hypothetical protein L6365_05415 [Desulfobulbaceae bacterium]|nr:hypothetical protein [Desulfobulbaceae bacterium]
MVKKEKAPELSLRRGRIRKVVEKVFGFKIWVVWDPNSKLPLAMRFATINVADCAMTKEVVEQALSPTSSPSLLTEAFSTARSSGGSTRPASPFTCR